MGLFDEKKEPVIFQLGVDEQASYYLLQTIKWKKFLAIVGIIVTAILLLAGIVSLIGVSAISAAGNSSFLVGQALGYGIGIVLFSLLYIYPILCLLRFCSHMRMALGASDNALFNSALKYQRDLWRFMGILMIVILALYGVLFLFGISRIF